MNAGDACVTAGAIAGPAVRERLRGTPANKSVAQTQFATPEVFGPHSPPLAAVAWS